MEKLKNRIIFIMFSIFIGAIAGSIIWLFLHIMNFGISLIWSKIPSTVNIPYYTLLVCFLGGIMIGLWQSKTKGKYPEELPIVIAKVKESGGYEYKKMPHMLISAILPLLVGASIGPEAGLTGVIAGLCTWVGDKFKTKYKEMKELTKIGISATLGVIFSSPLFGFMEPIESENEDIKIPKTSKLIIYFSAILGAIIIFMLLNSHFSAHTGMPKFNSIDITIKEWLFILPLIIIGIFSGYFYQFIDHSFNNIQSFITNHTFLCCSIGGLILGIFGTMLPYTMFSGEEQIAKLMLDWKNIGMLLLIVIGIAKIILTNICIRLGLKGGHFFPLIFAGVSIGYGFSILFGINSVFSIVIITTSLLSSIMRKPLATVLLLMLCFPAEGFIPMITAAIVGSSMQLFKSIKVKAN